jgi:hypothetical protein
LLIFVSQVAWRKSGTKLLLQNSLDLRGLLGLAMGSSLVVQVSSLMAYACCTNLILLQSVYISISTFVAWSWWMRSSDVDCPTESGSSMGQQKFTLRDVGKLPILG